MVNRSNMITPVLAGQWKDNKRTIMKFSNNELLMEGVCSRIILAALHHDSFVYFTRLTGEWATESWCETWVVDVSELKTMGIELPFDLMKRMEASKRQESNNVTAYLGDLFNVLEYDLDNLHEMKKVAQSLGVAIKGGRFDVENAILEYQLFSECNDWVTIKRVDRTKLKILVNAVLNVHAYYLHEAVDWSGAVSAIAKMLEKKNGREVVLKSIINNGGNSLVVSKGFYIVVHDGRAELVRGKHEVHRVGDWLKRLEHIPEPLEASQLSAELVVKIQDRGMWSFEDLTNAMNGVVHENMGMLDEEITSEITMQLNEEEAVILADEVGDEEEEPIVKSMELTAENMLKEYHAIFNKFSTRIELKEGKYYSFKKDSVIKRYASGEIFHGIVMGMIIGSCTRHITDRIIISGDISFYKNGDIRYCVLSNFPEAMIGSTALIINGPLRLREDGSIISCALAQPAFIDGVEYRRGDILYFDNYDAGDNPRVIRVVTEDEVKRGNELISESDDESTIN